MVFAMARAQRATIQMFPMPAGKLAAIYSDGFPCEVSATESVKYFYNLLWERFTRCVNTL